MSFSSILPVSSPEAQGVSSTAILNFLNAVEREPGGMHSFMLLRHGHLLAKGWWEPYQEDDPHMLFSLSKSFTSTAVGLAVEEGLFSIDDLVLPFFPDETPAVVSENLAAMRVRHLLSMSTGHAEDTVQHLREQPDNNWARAFLAQPVVYEPGTHFLYNSGASYMLSAIVQQLTGQTLLEYLTPRLYAPLGIEHPTWESCPRGINAGGWGMSITTEEIARFGQLYLQQGVWQGEQLVPESWVEAATSFQMDNAGSGMGEAEDDSQNDWAQGYGFQFWRCRHNAYRGDGAFGQFCVVMPEQDAVVAITSAVGVMQTVLDQIWTHLLPAMGEEPLPEDAAAGEQLTAKLQSLVLPTIDGQSTSPIVAAVSGRTYQFDENKQGMTALSFDFRGESCTMTLSGWAGVAESVFTASFGAWQDANQIRNKMISSPAAASGAWIEPTIYQMNIWLTVTPFCLTFTCRFDGDQLFVDEKINVSFEETLHRPQIVGHAEPLKEGAD